MYTIDENDVGRVVQRAVPSIATHIMGKVVKNVGFAIGDKNSPQAIHIVTKLLTLGLDKKTRTSIELELVTASGLPETTARDQIRFIRACAETVDEELVSMLVGTPYAADVWTLLHGDCKRDGALFLKLTESLSGDLLAAVNQFIVAYANHR
jgi:hypothetical protein